MTTLLKSSFIALSLAVSPPSQGTDWTLISEETEIKSYSTWFHKQNTNPFSPDYRHIDNLVAQLGLEMTLYVARLLDGKPTWDRESYWKFEKYLEFRYGLQKPVEVTGTSAKKSQNPNYRKLFALSEKECDFLDTLPQEVYSEIATVLEKYGPVCIDPEVLRFSNPVDRIKTN